MTKWLIVHYLFYCSKKKDDHAFLITAPGNYILHKVHHKISKHKMHLFGSTCSLCSVYFVRGNGFKTGRLWHWRWLFLQRWTKIIESSFQTCLYQRAWFVTFVTIYLTHILRHNWLYGHAFFVSVHAIYKHKSKDIIYQNLVFRSIVYICSRTQSKT